MEELEAILARIDSDDNKPTSDELKEAQTALKAQIKEARKGTDLEVLVTLKAAYDKVTEAITVAEVNEQQVQAQIDELLKDVDLEGGDEDEGDEGEDEGAGESADDSAKEPVLAGAGIRVLSLAEANARMRDRPQPPAQVDAPLNTRLRTFVNGRQYDDKLELEDIRKNFAEATRNPSTNGKHAIVRFETLDANGWMLSDDIAKRTNQVDAVVSPEAVAAAGGCCILPEPIREQTILGTTDRPIRDSLPSFGIRSTGAVTFYPPICIPGEGVAIWTCDDDAAVDPEDPETWKQCAEFDCDDPVVTTVMAIYRCITIGNFQRFFDGERWTAVLRRLLIDEARLAETNLFARMRAATTSTHVLGDTGSVFVSFIQGIGLASEIMRQDQRLADVNLRLWGPSWLREAMRADLVARRIVHVQDPVAADALINRAISDAGANVTWSVDTDIIDSTPNVGGPLSDYPGFAHLVLAPEGYFTYLDAGSFDLGTEIRDFNLTRQNAVAAFAEEFQGLMSRGCNAFSLDLPVSVCQTADGCEPLS
jgi:hypothetical protein